MKKVCVCLLACLILSFYLPVFADTPYLSYDSAEYSTHLATADAYVPEQSWDGVAMGCGTLNTPEDFAFNEDGNLYIADTGNNRIVVMNDRMEFVREYTDLIDAQGKYHTLRQPSSVCVRDGYLYIADSKNSRCIKADMSGNIKVFFEKPTDAVFTSETFTPSDISVNSRGMVYVISENVYQGIMVYDANGHFEGFFGSPSVTSSLQLLWDRFWKKILTDGQREGLTRYVPIEYAGFTVGEKDFIYAVLSYTSNHMEQIRKLNYLGENVYTYTGTFGEKEVFDYKKGKWYTQFIDVCSENELVYALDRQWQRVYVFDSLGNRLATMGTVGEQLGSFRGVAAVEVLDGRVFVLDGNKGNVTTFVPTAYGTQILTAVSLYNQGHYLEAIEPWKQVLAMSANNELAYSGIGEAYLKMGDYAQALEYFRLGGNRERESVAFEQYRAQTLRRWILPLLLVFFTLIVVAIVFTNKHFLAYLQRHSHSKKSGKWRDGFRNVVHTVCHPLDGFGEWKHKRYVNWPLTVTVLLTWLLVHIWKRQSFGFRFNENDPNDFSIIIMLASTVLPFILIAVANWAVCAIMNGEGRFAEIATYLAVSLIPYVMFTAISVPLSNVLTLNESFFLNAVWGFGIIWSGYLVFQSQRIVHNYSGGMTIGAAVLTMCTVVIMLVILLLLFALAQQIIYFATSVYSELIYRK